MSSDQGLSPEMTRLAKLVFEQPHQFEFFQAVRILEQEAAREAIAAGRTAPPEIGSFDQGVAVNSPVQFHSSATLRFPSGSITRAWRSETASDRHFTQSSPGITNLEVSCYGLIGPAGTLPAHYTSMVVDRLRHFRDDTLKSFLDLFVQRFVALNYRAWCKYRQVLRYEQALVSSRPDSWEISTKPIDSVTAGVSALVGLAGRGVSSRMAVEDDAVFRHSSHFSRTIRGAASLEQLVAEHLGVNVRVEQFVGRWLELEVSDQTSLASDAQPEGMHAQLGMGTLLGKRVWDVESTFEVILGPLTLSYLRRFLPGGHALQRLADFLRLYAGPTYEIVLRLVLSSAEVPPCRLGSASDMPAGETTNGGPRLGWTTWLVNPGGASEDRADTAFVLGR